MDRLVVIGGLIAVFFPYYYWRFRKERDPEWEARWRELSWRERGRLMKAARQGERPSDPEEAELVAGSARFQRTAESGLSPFAIIRLALAGLILLAAATTGSPLMIALALGFLALAAWLLYRDRARARNLKRAEADD